MIETQHIDLSRTLPSVLSFFIKLTLPRIHINPTQMQRCDVLNSAKIFFDAPIELRPEGTNHFSYGLSNMDIESDAGCLCVVKIVHNSI